MHRKRTRKLGLAPRGTLGAESTLGPEIRCSAADSSATDQHNRKHPCEQRAPTLHITCPFASPPHGLLSQVFSGRSSGLVIPSNSSTETNRPFER
jgi:hypothetical protein